MPLWVNASDVKTFIINWINSEVEQENILCLWHLHLENYANEKQYISSCFVPGINKLFSVKGHSKYLRLCVSSALWCNYSMFPFRESNYRQYANKWAWLCSITLYLQKQIMVRMANLGLFNSQKWKSMIT